MASKFKVKEEKGKIVHTHSSSNVNYEDECPVFSFKYLAKGTKYCISNCIDDDKIAFVDQFFKLSRLSWKQIKNNDRHKLGCEKINHFSIKTAIPPNITPDVILLAFRFNGKKPMIGFRDKATFHIIWFDKDFTLHNHG